MSVNKFIDIAMVNIDGIITIIDSWGKPRCGIRMQERHIKCLEKKDNRMVILTSFEKSRDEIIFDNEKNRDKWYEKFVKSEYSYYLEKKVTQKVPTMIQLEKKIDSLSSEIIELKDMIKYMTGAPGYKEAEKDFEEQKKTFYPLIQF